MINFWQRGLLLFTKPSQAFEEARTENVWHSILFIVLLGMIVTVLNAAITASFSRSTFFYMPLSVFGGGFIFLLIVWAIVAALFSLSAKLLQAKHGINETYKVAAYSATPMVLAMAIPTFGFLLTLLAFGYSSVLLVKGLRILQEMSTEKAITAIIVTLMVSILPAMLFIGYYFFLSFRYV